MPFANVAAGQIYYEFDGESSEPPIVLIAGQGAQLISWYPEFRTHLLKAGYRLLLFDNRDSGLSLDAAGEPGYGIPDMAADVAGLLDAIGVEKAHIVGQSMGGMIAQEVALNHPRKVLSLCSIYSAPSTEFITPSQSIWAVREEPPARDRDGAIRQYIEHERISGLDEFSEEWILAYATKVVDRAYRPEGKARQLEAVRRRPDRTAELSTISVPTLVIHGLDDVLIHHSGGLATAAAIRGAELRLYADMGHQLLPSLFEDYARSIARTCGRAMKHRNAMTI